MSRNHLYSTHALAATMALRVLAVSALFLAVLASVYIYTVMHSVAVVAAREEIMLTNDLLAAEVAAREGEYLARASAVTETFAYDAGFIPVRERIFIERGTLSFNNAR